MNLTLCLGFLCNIYRNPPTVRLFLGDAFASNENFVDEFELYNSVDEETVLNSLKSTIESKNHKDFDLAFSKKFIHPPLGLSPRKPMNDIINNDNIIKNTLNENLQLRFYSFESSSDRVKINLQFKNDDSNFTNGFITHSTMISMPVCFLVSTDLLKNARKFIARWSKNSKQSKNTISNNPDPRKVAKFYRKRNLIFANCMQPGKRNFYSYYEKKNTESFFFGGSGKIELDLSKKFNVFIEGSYAKGFMNIGQYEIAIALSDKYRQYEN